LRWTGWLSILLASVLVVSGAGSSFARSLLPIASAIDALQAREKSEKLRYPRSHFEFRHRDRTDSKCSPGMGCDNPDGQIAVEPALVFPPRGCTVFATRSLTAASADISVSARDPPAFALSASGA